MRAIQAETFSGYGGLRQIELTKPQPAKERVLVRVTAAGVTPLDHTILSGGHPRAKAPLVLGNEGARCHRGCRRLRARGGKPRDVHGTLWRW
jgi:NADPH:quinone reductase